MCYGNLFSYPLFFFFFFGISTVPGDDFGLIPRSLFLGFVGFLKNCLSVWFGEWVGSKIRFLVKRTEEFSYSCEHVLFSYLVIENWGITFNHFMCASKEHGLFLDCQ